MSPQEPAFLELSNSVKRIEGALLGDPMSGKNGIIHFHDKMKEDLYAVGPDGNPIEGKENTVLKRLSGIEDNQKKVIWVFSGLLLAFTAAKIGLTALVDKLFSR